MDDTSLEDKLNAVRAEHSHRILFDKYYVQNGETISQDEAEHHMKVLKDLEGFEWRRIVVEIRRHYNRYDTRK